jgi:transcriptional regulator with XRE-family HTH domain
MKRSSYSERDYAFGRAMLTLRTNIGLTQAGLAELLGVSRRAVAEWEAGSSYPKAEHLKQLIALAVQQQAFPAGSETEEIHSLWKAAHQKLLLDEAWRLADGYERVVILAPMPAGYGSIPGAAEDAAAMSVNANVFLVTPDEQSVAAIGPNPYDPTRRSAVATAGRAQGRSIASTIQAMW